MEVPFDPQPQQNSVFCRLWNFANCIGTRQYLTVFLICLFLFMSGAQHLLICLMILVFIFYKVSIFFAFSFYQILVLFLLISCHLYIKQIILLSVHIANIFPSLYFFKLLCLWCMFFSIQMFVFNINRFTDLFYYGFQTLNHRQKVLTHAKIIKGFASVFFQYFNNLDFCVEKSDPLNEIFNPEDIFRITDDLRKQKP